MVCGLSSGAAMFGAGLGGKAASMVLPGLAPGTHVAAMTAAQHFA